MTRSLVGAVGLPFHVMVRTDVLGSSIECVEGDARFTLTFPHIPEGPHKGNYPDLVGPQPASEDPVTGDVRFKWGFVAVDIDKVSADALVAQVESVAFLGTIAGPLGTVTDDARLAAGIASEFGIIFDRWLRRAVDWIELMWPNGQTFARESEARLRSRGQVWHAASKTRTGWGAHLGSVHAYQSDQALSLDQITAAFAMASRGMRPSDAWMLLLRARRTDDARRSVIDAGTAAEICLSRALHLRLVEISESARERVIQSCNGVVGMVRLLEEIDGVSAEESRWKRVADRLANVRNAAVHAGSDPGMVAGRALAESARILNDYDPLPAHSI